MDLRSHEQIEDMREELRDRFGRLPRDVDNLLYLVSLKIMARQMGVQSIASSDTDITVYAEGQRRRGAPDNGAVSRWLGFRGQTGR